MPAIHLFHRRTLFGGDDLQPAAFLSGSIRSFQLTFLLGTIWAHIATESSAAGGIFQYVLYDPSVDGDCRHSNLYALLLVCYAIASTVFGFASIILEWRISHWSGIGSPTQVQPRSRKVATLLEFKLIPVSIILFLVWMTGMSALSFAPIYYRCRDELQSVYHDDRIMEDVIAVSRILEDTATTSGFRIQLWGIAYGLLLLMQVSEVVVAWAFLLHLCRQPSEDFEGSWETTGIQQSHSANHELVEEMWADRCASTCQCVSVATCFLFGGRELMLGQAEFGDVARALADYLETRGVLDCVPSDIVTGLVVLQRLQRQRVYRSRREMLRDMAQANSVENGSNDPIHEEDEPLAREDLFVPLDSPRPNSNGSSAHSTTSQQSVYRRDANGSYTRHSRALLNRHNFADMTILQEGARYAKFALAIYTWVLYLYVHPVTGVPRLLAHSGCGCHHRRPLEATSRLSPRLTDNLIDEEGRIIGDNLCETHKAALLLTVGLEEADLVYAQLRSGFNEIPYCILLDHQWRSVVVSIRGTFSLEDCVTDVLIEPESLEELGMEFGFDGTGQYCHGGVLACARSVYRDLERHGLLDRLLVGEHARCPDYVLRLTGHSLGAATCTLLSYMLRPKFPSLRCVNYSPPGCSLTWEMAITCQEWCSSFVLDSDLVPRLSVDAMEHLRDEVLGLIGRIKVPKIEVARTVMNGSGILGCGMCIDRELEDQEHAMQNIDDLLFSDDEIPDSNYRRQLDRFNAIQEERRLTRGTTRLVKLFPPGRMVHLVKTGEERSCFHGLAKCLTCCTTNSGFEYTPMWVDNDDFNEIIVSPTMGADHFPNRVACMLERVASDFNLDIS
jgi:sn1-specific diacylglycerol lipase